MTKLYTLSQLAESLGAQLQGDGDKPIRNIATLAMAQEDQIAFLANSKYRSQLDSTAAGAVILSEKDAEYFSGNKLIIADPYVAYAKLAQKLDSTPRSADGIHDSAIISATATLGKDVSVGANAVIEDGAVIGDGVEIGPGCFIGKYTKIGTRTKLWANVTVYHEVQIGEDCLFQSGSVIGSDGFGYANEKGEWVKIPQVGTVIIGDRVEVGASTSIDRGALEDTIIHSNVILDNQIQIAHNVEVGYGTAIAGCTVLAGSVKIGKYCQIGGMSAINGHNEVCDGVVITGMSMVTKSITQPGIYSSGLPHQTNKEWRKSIAHLRNLSDFKSRLKALELLTAQLKDTDVE
ncbi:UDP-3-O-(3-hydroxymyristoyl)glucosamine N-acyltransferase [Pseudoalteromonas sp. McH1-7]|uniref:UDP-3-O-acylglucosamine N-acyltransferase n=1 Tax=Pseudoalteromonas peptidolytica F12-50-A1 TaxID=1315280 RepID=A0A8I0MU35_9GAMM|nr:MULTISPECIES: UDP-3-O-(3-hydroxymyristoyl)glucosamine N-acyltransferase [Pseudoalteromonas]MBE0345890.1 UDP-3-O-[3-hydroxymyristoyl] glucosamine N-acyltransferase [Pseudoalteromonas peptidolytica F12-50-A1]NLR16026.1 UDP-3-O-(3-hydroxymyristoyl)glucosamine N-acyltransferase [Pseudoalteromonas peptidolytica]NUZ11038.1 UDP-3-O-(3-hydroxymyristoyl)glucosamine N-acyltransferase [Pseudoalteromonas sp. McH1-7]RXF02050.1 UDP-3-O-(3-hydroxymyristoyl)glucosamine N-acyltransferase [Pseudoalteromonas s